MLELRKVAVHYGAVKALDGVDLTLPAGQVVGLMGDNGAGKSTLVKVLAGNFQPTAGTITLDGAPVTQLSPKRARELGIEVVYQDLALCDNLTASANLYLGRELMKRRFGLLRSLDHRAMREGTQALFDELQTDARPESLVSELSGGQRQAVAIARTLLEDPRWVLLDEPTAAISVRQIEEVLALIRRLKERGVGVLLISHRMDDVFAVCDRVVVLRRGSLVADREIRDTSREEITAFIVGALERAS